ncbi:TMV resistance protein N-like [Dorcoceras hygrometricum]|uniref:TMV resistance protein N-like n=1 Tax=Dorcoceras hygrometricum TaxID=472368 RepID=A0A2Z6ZXW5_9LAMI|nr:TMV resistance protein N-like [Dorcoceras hygrometricum]
MRHHAPIMAQQIAPWSAGHRQFTQQPAPIARQQAVCDAAHRRANPGARPRAAIDHCANMCVRPAALGRPPCAASAHGSSRLHNEAAPDEAPAIRGQRARTARVYVRGGAPQYAAAPRRFQLKILFFDSEKLKVRYNKAQLY